MIEVVQKLNKTLLLYVLLFSGLTTMLVTFFQLYSEYKKDIDRLELLSSQVQISHVKGLTSASWNMDVLQIQLLLDGLVAIPEVTYANVMFRDKVISENGDKNNKNTISKTLDLSYEKLDEQLVIGQFNYHISKDEAIQSLINQFFIILVSNFFRTFLVAGFILFIVDHVITRHLRTISKSVKQLGSFEHLNNKIKLEGERKKANELDLVVGSINELLESLQDLWKTHRISEVNFFQLMDNANQGIIISTDGKIDFCNKQFLSMFNYNSVNDIDIDRISPLLIQYEDQEQDDSWEIIAEKNEQYKNVRNFHSHGNNKDFEFYTTATLWNNRVGTLLMFIDVTDANLLKKELKKQQIKMIQMNKMDTLSVMVAGVTHEINNPNMLIKINSEILRKSWDDFLPVLDKYYKDHPKQLVQNIPYKDMSPLLMSAYEDNIVASTRIEKIVSGLSTFIQGDDNLEMSPNRNLTRIINETINLLNPQISKRDIEIELEIAENLPLFEANSSLINQVFVNIILNAIEACDEKRRDNTGKGKVKIIAKSAKGNLIVIIEDNGVGIKADALPNVFELFHSSKLERGGTGIGLSIVYSLIKMHQGDISIESEEGVGSKFTITLPISQGNNKS